MPSAQATGRDASLSHPCDTSDQSDDHPSRPSQTIGSSELVFVPPRQQTQVKTQLVSIKQSADVKNKRLPSCRGKTQAPTASSIQGTQTVDKPPEGLYYTPPWKPQGLPQKRLLSKKRDSLGIIFAWEECQHKVVHAQLVLLSKGACHHDSARSNDPVGIEDICPQPHVLILINGVAQDANVDI